MKSLFFNATLLLSDRVLKEAWLIIEDDIILDFGEGVYPKLSYDFTCDCNGLFLSPGFIDIHVHGGGGFRLYDNSQEAVETILRTHLSHGTTSIYPTMTGLCHSEMVESLISFDSCIKKISGKEGFPHFEGLHLEGPFVSGAVLGAGDQSVYRDPDFDQANEYLAIAPYIKRWTVAPERQDGMKFGRFCERKGIAASIGHSNASLDQVFKAFENGYHAITHLYSACSVYHREGAYRKAGIVEAAWLIDNMDVEMITDGVHLPKEFIQLIYKLKGPEHIALVSDATRWAGVDVSAGKLLPHDGKKLFCYVENGVALVEDRSCFAGSVATADRLVRTAHKIAKINIVDSVRMATLTPARMAGIDSVTGSIHRGKRADLLVFDDDIVIKKIVCGGRFV